MDRVVLYYITYYNTRMYVCYIRVYFIYKIKKTNNRCKIHNFVETYLSLQDVRIVLKLTIYVYVVVLFLCLFRIVRLIYISHIYLLRGGTTTVFYCLFVSYFSLFFFRIFSLSTTLDC